MKISLPVKSPALALGFEEENSSRAMVIHPMLTVEFLKGSGVVPRKWELVRLP